MKIERRYDIDWLRVIAIGLLLIYHIAIVFQPWALFIGFIKSNESLEALWKPMTMLNVWRIPLLFYVSGMGLFFAMRKRNWKQLLLERTKRILLPFLFGIVAITPIHMYIFQIHYSFPFDYVPHQGHLWFLRNIFIYVLLLTPLFYFLKKHENGKVKKVNEWQKGIKNGLFFSYDSLGNMVEKGKYRNNIKVNTWINYKTKDTIHYKKGEAILTDPLNKKDGFFKRVFKKKDANSSKKEKSKKVKKANQKKPKKDNFFKRLFNKKEKNNT